MDDQGGNLFLGHQNVAEAKQTLKSGDHPELDAKKEAAKSQEKASMAAAKKAKSIAPPKA